MVPSGYNPKFLYCRSDGHTWVHQTTESIPNARGMARRTLWCPTHEGYRIDTVNMQTGEIVKRAYVTSGISAGKSGYYIHGQGKTPRSEFRRVLVRHEMKEAA